MPVKKEAGNKTKSWTPARKKAFIVAVLRNGSRRWPPKYETLNEAKTEKKINPKTKRLAQHYRCALCQGEFPQKDVEVNHKIPVVDPHIGFQDWNTFIERLFSTRETLEVLCKPCHKQLTLKENKMREHKFHKPTYQSWWDMVDRCTNPQSCRWYTHGERGITVCERWIHNYSAFLEDMGEKPNGRSLDRIDNGQGYSKSNCRWATPKQQANNRSTNILVDYDGKTQTVMQWAEELNLSFAAMLKRLRNWPLDKAMSPTRYEVVDVPEDIKQEILDLHLNHHLSQGKLSKMYGVSQTAISKWKIQKEQHAN